MVAKANLEVPQEVDTDRVIADLRALNRFGAAGKAIWRTAYSRPDIAARAWLGERFAEFGLDVSIDGVGNLFGRDVRAERCLLLGSHSDSVPNGGWLDGALGVIYALAAARTLAGHAGAVGIDLISFGDEEGCFLGCLGSSSFTGKLTERDLDAARSRDGTPLREALGAAGLGGKPRAIIDPGRTVAFLEAHIEQGPRLEAAGVDIGIVEAIVGLRRQMVRFSGRADHAGTTPMALRRDAARRMFVFANAVTEELSRVASPQSAWNIGIVRVAPGAGNIVPSDAEIMVEYRDVDAAILDRMTEAVLSLVAREDGRDGVAVAASPAGRLEPAQMAPELGELIAEAAKAIGASAMRMASGAGHDAQNLASRVPAAMLFVPSIDGRSHDPSENTKEEDIRRGARVYVETVRRLIDRGSAD